MLEMAKRWRRGNSIQPQHDMHQRTNNVRGKLLMLGILRRGRRCAVLDYAPAAGRTCTSHRELWTVSAGP